MDHEKNIQSQQTQESPQVRLPCTNENCRGTQSHPQKTQNRKTRSCSLVPSDKLKKRVEFLKLKHQGHRLVGRLLCVDLREGHHLRFGITASKRYGNAPERNRFKRLVREAFRTARHLLPPNLEFNVAPRQKAKEAKMQDIQQELLYLLIPSCKR
jgi:ribonuclease P protein component